MGFSWLKEPGALQKIKPIEIKTPISNHAFLFIILPPFQWVNSLTLSILFSIPPPLSPRNAMDQ
jgi:hypothetical protein